MAVIPSNRDRQLSHMSGRMEACGSVCCGSRVSSSATGRKKIRWIRLLEEIEAPSNRRPKTHKAPKPDRDEAANKPGY